jgi:hypothetical protein
MLHVCSYYTAHVLLGGSSTSHENKASSSTRTGTRLETIASWTILLPNQPQLLGSFGILTHIYICILYIGAVQNHCWWSTIWDYTRQYIEDYQHPLWESLLTRHYRGTTEGLTMLICSTIVNHQLKPPVNQWFNCSHQQIKKQIT